MQTLGAIKTRQERNRELDYLSAAAGSSLLRSYSVA